MPRRLIILGLALALGAAAWAERPYSNPSLGFTLTPPDGWQMRNIDSVSSGRRTTGGGLDDVVTFVAPAPAAVKRHRGTPESDAEFLERIRKSLGSSTSATVAPVTISVVVMKTGSVSLKAFMDKARAEAANSNARAAALHHPPIFKEISQHDTRLAGETAAERVMIVAYPGEPALQTREVMCVHAGRMYTVTLAGPPADYGKYNAHFDKVLTSFRWGGKPTP